MSVTLKRSLTVTLILSLALSGYFLLLSTRAGAEADLDRSEPPPPNYQTRTDRDGNGFMLVDDMPTTIEVLNANGDIVGYSRPADVFGPPSFTPSGTELSARAAAVEEEGAPVYENADGTGKIVGHLPDNRGFIPDGP